ncbi:LAGLIDADG family homing endonuclease [Cytobacillus sp. FJAT-54145]|uniref:LAGLIDADG family homing endonuclease n=1 Tax=Cytobacillus spartinae TaxID=3299023 RepID=A0ABW6KDY2_9BACI
MKTMCNKVNHQEIIRLYENGESLISIANRYEGLRHYHVDYILRKHNIPKRSNKVNSRKYSLNHHFFDVVDSEEKAYWLGFIAADGYITTKENIIGISLHHSDESHLEKFKKAINATYPVHQYRGSGYGGEVEYVRIAVRSDQVWKMLKEHGILENKSLILTFPESIPPNFYLPFIRGYFDGDGSLSYYKKKDAYTVKIAGTKEMLEAITTILGYPNRKLYKRYKNSTKNTYSVEIGGRRQVVDVMNKLYHGATVYLERKHNRYLQLLQSS